MNERVKPLLEILALNTRLFRNCLAGVDDVSAQRRPGSEANNMTFIAAHLLDARAWMARYLGVQYRHPFEDELATLRELAFGAGGSRGLDPGAVDELLAKIGVATTVEAIQYAIQAGVTWR